MPKILALLALLGATNAALNNPCLQAPYSTMPWCNTNLAIDERVADMLSRMNISEKIPSLNTDAPDIKSLGLNGYNWWEEASTGVSNGHATTKFAFPITIGMSFNRTLWQLTGRQIGHEARALMNAGLAGSTYWAPVVNLAREPRWGRNIEGDITHISIPRSFIHKIEALRARVLTGLVVAVPGEDPYHSGDWVQCLHIN